MNGSRIGAPQDLHWEQNVVQNSPPRHEICLLEDDPKIRVRLHNVAPIDPNRSTRGWNQSTNNLEECRFPAAAWPEESDKMPSL